MTREQTQFMVRILCAATGLLLAGGISGCSVHVDKGANGEDKSVQVDTPFGGVHVNTNQTTAADLGLPAYPGAQMVTDADHDHDKSADIDVGFGRWELKVKAVNYSAPAPQEKVEAFYKNALGRYGDVITCQDDQPVGTPASTSEGLTCADEKHAHVNVQGDGHGYHSGHEGLQLKAGSERHQHIVAFGSASAGQTRFSLVAVDLPAGTDGGSGKSD